MSSVSLEKVKSDGKASGTVDVSASVFGIEPNQHVLYQAVRRQLANARMGSANTKTRSEVRGGGRKPWKQKGTGRARAGSIRSPLWAGGGVIFGPKPRDFSITMPKKVRQLAIKSALSSKRDAIRVVEDFSFLSAPKTKDMVAFLKSMELCQKKVLILADYKAEANQHLMLSARNIPGVTISLPHNISVAAVLNADAVILAQGAVDEIDARYRADV